MSSLKNLIALNKAKQQGVTIDAVSANSPAVRDEGTPVPSEAVSQDLSSVATISPAREDASGTAETPTPKRLRGLNLLKRASAPGGSGSTGTQRVVQPAPASSIRPATIESQLDGSTEFSLDDLAGFDETVTPVVERSSDSGFVDEIEATAPDRDLPADLEPAQLSFVESLDNIYQVLNDPEMFGQSVRIIMMELQENPEYIKLISDQDVHTMIRAMRNTMGLARIKKQEKTRKTGTTARAKKKGAAAPEQVMNVLDSLFGDDDD